MAESCVIHMIAVKSPYRSDSNTRNINRIVVAAGLNLAQSATDITITR